MKVHNLTLNLLLVLIDNQDVGLDETKQFNGGFSISESEVA